MTAKTDFPVPLVASLMFPIVNAVTVGGKNVLMLAFVQTNGPAAEAGLVQ